MILTIISWIAIALGVLTSFAIALDCYERPQQMSIMNATWPITGLYLPIVGWWVYRTMGRPDSISRHRHTGHDAGGNESRDHDGGRSHHHASKPKWQSVFVGVTHCGGGCTLGDCVATAIVSALGFTVLGSSLLGHFVGEFIGAYLFGIAFQLLPILEMGEHSLAKAFVNAIKADTLSLVAFEVGMFGWIAIAFLLILPNIPSVGSPSHWFMMQIAMNMGFATAYPANWWLVNRGIKHGM